MQFCNLCSKYFCCRRVCICCSNSIEPWVVLGPAAGADDKLFFFLFHLVYSIDPCSDSNLSGVTFIFSRFQTFLSFPFFMTKTKCTILVSSSLSWTFLGLKCPLLSDMGAVPLFFSPGNGPFLLSRLRQSVSHYFTIVTIHCENP